MCVFVHLQITGQTSNPEHIVAWLLDHSNLDDADIDSAPAAPPLPPPPVVPVQAEEGRDDEYDGDGEGEDDDDSSSEDSDGFELNVDTAAVTGIGWSSRELRLSKM